MDLEIGKKYKLTRMVRGEVEKEFVATINSVEDRGDFWYVGYEPDDKRICQWGYLKVKKVGQYKTVNYKFEEI